VEKFGKIEPGEIQMKTMKFSERQIVNILKDAEVDIALEELVHQHSRG